MTLSRRFHFWLQQMHHRMLMRVSRSYRMHDVVVTELNTLRRECVQLRLSADKADKARVAAEADLSNARTQLQLSDESREQAVRRLAAERSLRESADLRAESFHQDLLEAMRAHADWLAVSCSRRPVFGAAPVQPESAPRPINTKPLAREVARATSNETLRRMYEEILAGNEDGVPAAAAPTPTPDHDQ